MIGPSIGPWGTPNGQEQGLEMILYILRNDYFHSNNFQKCALHV